MLNPSGTLLFALCMVGAGGSAAAEDGGDVKENVVLMRQEMQRIGRDLAHIQAMLEDLPKLYVPRAEHDLRDRNLDRGHDLARLEERMRYVEKEQRDMEARTQNWMWDIIKVLGGVGFGGAGAFTWIRSFGVKPVLLPKAPPTAPGGLPAPPPRP